MINDSHHDQGRLFLDLVKRSSDAIGDTIHRISDISTIVSSNAATLSMRCPSSRARRVASTAHSA
jgi:hypothetical protein